MSKKLTREEFVERARKVHGDKYDYSKVEYKSSADKVEIICPAHGSFWQSPLKHLAGQGCPTCGRERFINSRRLTTEKFIEKARVIHGDKYDYSRVDYKNCDSNVEIVCPIHGPFFQAPTVHIHLKCGCPHCKLDFLSQKFRTPIDKLRSMFFELHGDAYEYPNLEDEYVNNRSIITIICKEHGPFKQTVMKHLRGHGCRNCQKSKLETEIELLLKEHDIPYETQMEFAWLRLKHPMQLDFYLPSKNIAIECQGIQHFEPVQYFGGDAEFELVRTRDQEKARLCEENGIKLLYFSRESFVTKHYFESIYTDKQELWEAINSYGT